jgi:YD repeat-containing protein
MPPLRFPVRDAAHRLIGARLPDGKEQVFSYDPAGNLVRQPGLEGVALRDGNRLASANGDRFEYNDRSQVAVREGRKGQTHYLYDACDRLTEVRTPEGTWQARYDPLGRRVRKSWGKSWVEYYWDNDRVTYTSAYHPHGATGGSNTFGVGIAVHGEIHDDDFAPGIPAWRTATPAERADAVIFHELSEINSPHAGTNLTAAHQDGVRGAPTAARNAPVPVSENTLDILDQMRPPATP